MSRPRSAAAHERTDSPRWSVARTTIAALLFAGGLAWVLYYIFAADDGSPPWMADLGDWNLLIGFGAHFVGLGAAAHHTTPLGRGRGVVVGMLGSFLVGLVWIVVYYMTSQDLALPVISDLGNYNLLVGVGYMATGFVFATKWE